MICSFFNIIKKMLIHFHQIYLMWLNSLMETDTSSLGAQNNGQREGGTTFISGELKILWMNQVGHEGHCCIITYFIWNWPCIKLIYKLKCQTLVHPFMLNLNISVGIVLNILGSDDNDELVMEKCVESTMVTLMCSLLAPKEGYTHSS